MCTAITLQTTQGETFFGRTMDFSYALDMELYIISKGYEWTNELHTARFQNQYSYIGIGQNVSEVLLADGVNEMGFACAVLYFPGYAVYDSIPSGRTNKKSQAAYEIVKFLLGRCKTVEDAAMQLQNISIIGIPDHITNAVAPLHWICTDKSGQCLVIEKTKTGLHLFYNPIGVLANSPDLPWHTANLRNYLNVSPNQLEAAQWNNVALTPFGQGAGTFGLPGDFTSPSRFIRAAYLKSHIFPPETREEAVLAGFHILNGVSLPHGAVMTARKTDDYTQHTALLNTATGEYFIKTYQNPEIATARLPKEVSFGAAPQSLGKLTRPVQFFPFHTQPV